MSSGELHSSHESEIIQERLKKLDGYRGEKGVEPFGKRFLPKDAISGVIKGYEEGKRARVAGRLTAVRAHGKSAFGDVKDGTGKVQVYAQVNVLGEEAYERFKKLDIGDFVGVEGTLFKSRTGEISVKIEKYELLSKIIQVLPEKWHGLKDVEIRYRRRYLDLIANDEVRRSFRTRSEIIKEIRRCLDAKGFMEVETPMMQPIPGGAKAEPFKTHHRSLHRDLYLRVAPELYLKRLLVGGYEKVYEINRNFRNEGLSTKHNPEFTMLELYWAFADYTDVMELTEELITSLVEKIHGTTEITYGRKKISFKRPWKRVSFYDALKEKSGVDWRTSDVKAEAKKIGLHLEEHFNETDIINDAFDELVEPNLTDPTFITDYPTKMSPLAKQKADDPELTYRFELFAASLEMANAFSELNDPVEQRKRFEKQSEELEGKKVIDEDFLLALEYAMPPAGGLGIGIDRLVMLLTDKHSIRDVILFPQLKAEHKEEG